MIDFSPRRRDVFEAHVQILIEFFPVWLIEGALEVLCWAEELSGQHRVPFFPTASALWQPQEEPLVPGFILHG